MILHMTDAAWTVLIKQTTTVKALSLFVFAECILVLHVPAKKGGIH